MSAGHEKLARCLAAALALTPAALAGCADGDDEARPRLTVSAAASLKVAFTEYGRTFERARARFGFAGSDELAAQIRQGVRPDVYAAANAELPAKLHREGRVEEPVVFARNRLVIAIPRGSRIRRLADLAAPGAELAIGADGVPVGAYSREVLGRLRPGQSRAILANVRSNEPDVTGVVGKLARGAADAGFLYASDVRAAGGELRAIELPRRLRPRVSYAVAVVRGAARAAEARAFVAGLRFGAGARALRRAGLEPVTAAR